MEIRGWMGNCNVRSVFILRNGVPEHVDKGCCEVRQDCHQQDELGKFGGTPCPLQVFPTVEDCRAGDEQRHHILLGERSCEIDPGVEEGPLGDDGEKALVKAAKNVARYLMGDGDSEEQSK